MVGKAVSASGQYSAKSSLLLPHQRAATEAGSNKQVNMRHKTSNATCYVHSPPPLHCLESNQTRGTSVTKQRMEVK